MSDKKTEKPAEKPAEKPKRQTDREILAMARLAKIVGELSQAERKRVVEWLADRYGAEAEVAP